MKTDFKLLHRSKACFPIIRSESGKVTEVNAVQPEKANLSISYSELPKVTDVNALHP